MTAKRTLTEEQNKAIKMALDEIEKDFDPVEIHKALERYKKEMGL